jgi:uncharacterized lipoprotein YddW (UPF0748 family)
MKQLLIILSVLTISYQLLAATNEEFRATWVITWEHISESSSAATNQARVREIMENHKSGNFNAVLWQARQGGTAYYPSSYEPWGGYAGEKDPGYDPLGYAVAEAHHRGMELHAWFNAFQTSSTAPGTPVAEHPEWVCRNQAGRSMDSYRALSPGLAAVREYTIQVAMEIVRNYDIDGLHLDYVRWNEYSSTSLQKELGKMAPENRMLDGQISEAQLEELHAPTGSRYLYDVEHPYSAGVPQGYSSWEDFWLNSVTEFVRTLHDSIQAVKPWVRLSVASLGRYNWGPWQAYGDVYQDAALWFNAGYIEQLTPMSYHWTTGDGFYGMLTGDCPNCWGQFLTEGIEAGRLFSPGPGSYILAESKIWNRHEEIVGQSRTVPWVDGFQFFSYGSWRDYQGFEIAANSYFERPTKIRANGLIDKTPPNAPSISLEKNDDFHYQLTVTPAAGTTENQRYAIYRSEDALIDPAQDLIIDIHFGKTAYSVEDGFDGLQNYEGIYHYAATALDRYWNESLVSNSVQTDEVVSFAPVVVANVAEGDTISVNEIIKLNFSKTMNSASFTSAISFVPAVEIKNLVWASDQKSVTMVRAGNLEFDTHYQMTLSGAVTDAVGKSLDGNADGTAGDAFNLNFRTKAVDDEGPRLLSSFPTLDDRVEDFDVAGVLTFVFDEPIEPNSITSENIQLTHDGMPINCKFHLLGMNQKTILSVQSEKPLEINTEYQIALSMAITDTLGNALAEALTGIFVTAAYAYTETVMIEDFSLPGEWWQPNASGSTVGIVTANTVWGYTRSVYIPAPSFKKSAFLQYAWDLTASSHLLREYLSGGSPRAVLFDTSYTLQCYIFGDGSNNKIRFAVDDSPSYTAHEVSKWVTIDWYGWRLVEWDLSDPNSVGSWIGDGVLNGPNFRFDSFQLTRQDGSANTGMIYFDNFQLVKKSASNAVSSTGEKSTATTFRLDQNYPNPFNPTTKMAFSLPEKGGVKLTVFDLLGREVQVLINRELASGNHEIGFDGSNFASGLYFYQIEFGNQRITRSMLLMK